MSRRRLSRALIALAVPALTVPAATSAATSAATAAGAARVPTIDQVAAIWTHVEGGSAHTSTGKVFGPGKKCKQGKAIKGASATSATYSPDYTSGDPDVFEITGETPMLSVTAMRFPTKKAATAYLRGYGKSAKDCPGVGSGGGGGTGAMACDIDMKKIAFTLGDERWGYQYKMKCTRAGQTTRSVFNSLFAREGKFIVYANVMSMDASAPSIPTSVDLTELAMEAVS